MQISQLNQKRAREAAEAADEAEALQNSLQDEYEEAKMEKKRAEALAVVANRRALKKWFDKKHAEKKAKKLRTESNRLNPEPKFDQEAAPAEKKYKDAATDP